MPAAGKPDRDIYGILGDKLLCMLPIVTSAPNGLRNRQAILATYYGSTSVGTATTVTVGQEFDEPSTARVFGSTVH